MPTTLTAAGVKSLISSPSLRCIETLQPTARAIGATVAIDNRLAEGRSGVDVVELMAHFPISAAICSHGDVIPDTMAAPATSGMRDHLEPDWRKGSVWVLDRDADGEIVAATAGRHPTSLRAGPGVSS